MRLNKQQYKIGRVEKKNDLKKENFKSKKMKYFHWTIVVLYMAMIYYFSSQDGAKSHEVSSRLLEYLKFLALYVPEGLLDFFSGVGKNHEYILRKCAHFTEYLILSLIVYKAMRASEISFKKSILLTFIICFVYAVSDEVHQYFVPGRAFAVTDIMIDTAGAILGLMTVVLFNFAKEKRTGIKNLQKR